uniref:Uncharacterized protein n=1 Tax=Eptatretus burgeri TaxID=7764 RepID=A0A8C4N920_EPTBU
MESSIFISNEDKEAQCCDEATLHGWRKQEVPVGANITNVTDSAVTLKDTIAASLRQSQVNLLAAISEGIADMVDLEELHEAAILFNLHFRYRQDKIYTYISKILVAVNPYKVVPGLYSSTTMARYRGRHLGHLPPHIYGVASECHLGLRKCNRNQCVLISGESGAGKTESAKFILHFLAGHGLDGAVRGVDKRARSVSSSIVQSGPLLEAFGNARTVFNGNSSRFGKFTLLHFSPQGTIQGGCQIPYLLEKNRVVRQSIRERNFHVFYAIFAGATESEKERLSLTTSSSYHYLNCFDRLSEDDANDRNTFKKIMTSLDVFGFCEDEKWNLLELLAAILHIGNIQFVDSSAQEAEQDGGGTTLKMTLIPTAESLRDAAKLLGIPKHSLAEMLTQRALLLREELIVTPFSTKQAECSRDALAMALYANCFSWLLDRVNLHIHGKQDFKTIGILDIFGFENFEINRFEQFNINYANEKLQEYFNKHIFLLEQQECHREGIELEEISWTDNSECLALIEKQVGILALINEETQFPKGTDETLLEKLHKQHSVNACYIRPRVLNHQFGIRHYAGEVLYNITGFLENNRDSYQNDFIDLLQQSSSGLVRQVCDAWSSRREVLGTTCRRPTVVSRFRDSLHSLVRTLGSAQPFFIRCIKPNCRKMPEQFEQSVVLCQLRYSGMLEMVKIRQAGFPVRRLFQDFYDRYYPLARKLPLPEDIRGKCASLLKIYDSDGMDWQLGKNKVFLRETLEYKLEKRREEEVERASSVIHAYILGYCTRKWYGLLRCSAVIIQRCYRAYHHRRRFLELRHAALQLQKVVRGYLARRRCRHIVEAKQKEGHGSVLLELPVCPSDIDREQQPALQNKDLKADKSPHNLDGQSTMLTDSTTPPLGKGLSTLVQVGFRVVDEACSSLKVQKQGQCDLEFSQSPVEEALQVEMVTYVTDNNVEEPVGELCLPLDDEAVRRLDADATLAAQEFLNSLQLDEFFQDVEQTMDDGSLEDPTSTGRFPYAKAPVDHPNAARPAMTPQVYSEGSQLDNEYAEIIEPEADSLLNNFKQQRDEEEDEGLGVEDDGSFRETASKSVTPTMMPAFVEGLLSDQRTSGVRTCSEEGDSSSEEQFYSNEIIDPTCLKTNAFDCHSVHYSHPDFPVNQSNAHIYEMVIPSAPPLPMTRCISLDYTTVDGKAFGFNESPPAYPGSSDANIRATLRTPPPSYEPQEENIYSECHAAEERRSSSSSSSVFTCSSTTKFSITPNSQPVTIDYNYCISVGGATVQQRSRHRSEGSAKLYWRRTHSRDRYSQDCESPHVGSWSHDVSRWKRNQAPGRVKGTEWAGYRGVLGRNGSVGGSSSRTLLSSCDDDELEGEMQPDTDDELTYQEEDAYSCIGSTTHQGYLNIRDGVAFPWCRCWCVLDGQQFRWYAACHPLYTGWLYKKRDSSWGGLARRRSGCRRWFVLCGSHLAYYDDEGPVERPHGHIDIQRAREILYYPEKEHEIEVVMDDQVHRLSASNAKEARRLLSVLRQVHGNSELELQHTFQSSPKRQPILGTLDMSKVSAICTSEVANRPNSFGISAGCRSLQCDADTAEEMGCWIALLHRSKAELCENGHGIVMRGWLYKGPTGHSPKPSLLQLKRRWFVLNTDCLEYYRTCEPHSPIMGALTLMSLCSVVPPDEQVHKNTGYWNITVHGRKNSLRLYTKLLPEAARWAKAVQQVIDGKSQTETPTLQLMRDIAESAPYPDDVEEIYRKNSIINHSHRPLHSPLLPLPFGDIPPNVHSEHGYTSLGDEAVRLFHCLLQLDATHDPVPIVQGMLQTCVDLPPLRDELYCQLVKQTSDGGIAHSLRAWQVFACMSCCFVPCSFVLQYLVGHLHRVRARLAGTEAERYVEFVYGAIERTRDRQIVPSRAELQAIMALDEVTAMVYCHGGGSCQISISSHITAGEVVERLLKGLEMEGSRNRFSLFEHGPDGELAIESRTLLVDVLARFERVIARSEIPNKLQPKIIFKIYCFLDTVGVPHDSIEFAFMFEQAHEEVIRGHFPASEENLQWLAALRLQFVHGNCPPTGFDGTELSLADVYPTVQHVGQPSSLADESLLSESSSKCPPSEKEDRVRRANKSNLRTGLLRRSLRAAGSLSLRLRRRDSEPGMESRPHDEPLLPRVGLLDKWRQLQGLDPQDASRKYMQLICRWSGYGSTIFDVLSTDSRIPRELWLGVSAEAVSIYLRGEKVPRDSLQYERIASFGVPSNKLYRLQVDNRELLFKTTQVRIHHSSTLECTVIGNISGIC